jgi:ectonucleoside triphosphate diphosphohydrolase 5/6
MEHELRRRGAGARRAEGAEGTSPPRAARGETVDRSFTVVLVLVLGALAASVAALSLAPDSVPGRALAAGLDASLATLGVLPRQYAVVLDAGSTGSRVLAFTFHRHAVTGALVLEDELWEESKPGLSRYADRPAEGAASIERLLALAQARVPAAARPATPVTLMATAGLRLLPAAQSDALIAAVKGSLDASGFDNRGVDIMSELNEGVYGWLTVNYLLHQLDNPPKSYVALDLGGGSTQVTFAPKHEKTLAGSPASFLHQIPLSGAQQTLYSHSYLGLGLMSARESVFRLHDPPGAATLGSACVLGPAEFRDLQVAPEQASGYEGCMVEVQQFLDSLNIDQCDEVPTRKIAAFSYFHDRAVDAGMLGEGESGVVTVQQYLDAAETACAAPNPASPFLCVDLTFIGGLLHHGYHLAASARLGLYKQIDGHQTSWALGAAFNLLE